MNHDPLLRRAKNLLPSLLAERREMNAEIATLRDSTKVSKYMGEAIALEKERDALREKLAKAREALKFIACDGMDDGDFYAEEWITEGTIAMANRARRALAEIDGEERKDG